MQQLKVSLESCVFHFLLFQKNMCIYLNQKLKKDTKQHYLFFFTSVYSEAIEKSHYGWQWATFYTSSRDDNNYSPTCKEPGILNFIKFISF